ncbi:MAG: penicillin-binding protein 2 [bacterium]|nr:penicillin-binding protein 2 [bacterium]
MYSKTPAINIKIRLIAYCSSLALILITARLLYLQINLTTYFFDRSQHNFLRMETVRSPRGNIIDRTGKLLATNRPVINLYWQGTGNYTFNDAQQKLLSQLEDILDKPIITNPSLKNNLQYAEQRYQEIRMASDITFEQLSKIKELFSNQPNISIKTDCRRHYPYKSYASHLVGYLGHSIDVDSYDGQMGLEKMFEHILKGETGIMLKTINSIGRKLAEKEIKAPFSGEPIQTTINIELQELCEKIFPEDAAGTIILMDPKDGDILALVSRPDFDPNIFLQPISPEKWQQLQEKKPFLNRALNACYPPGSLFKLITVSAALEHGLISPESTVRCRGSIHFGDRKYRCHCHEGHGELTIAQALAQSCNILCYEIGKQIDVDILAKYAYKFGLGQKTNIIFPEKQGLVPTKTWKQETKGERWRLGETLSVAIGQSFVLVTPIQIASMISSIFTGIIPTPRFLSIEKPHGRPLDIKSETLAFLKKSMKLVVTMGTGQRVSRIKDFEIYAKTSTAQTSLYSKRTLGSNYLEHGWFAAHLTYKTSSPLVAVILIENVGSSMVAANVVLNFLIAYKKLIDQKII